MKFTAIPDDELEFHKGQRMLFLGPADSGIGDLETMRREVDGFPLAAITARVELEDGDLKLLQSGFPIYVTQYGGLIPMSVDIPTCLAGRSAPLAGNPPCPECGWEVGHAWTCSQGRNDP